VHTLDVGTFPVVDGEDDRLPRRLIAITSIDGRPVGAGAVGVSLLDRWLSAQQPPYRPTSIRLGSVSGQPALLVMFDALPQTGLLPQ
jgi:hypothetical protein